MPSPVTSQTHLRRRRLAGAAAVLLALAASCQGGSPSPEEGSGDARLRMVAGSGTGAPVLVGVPPAVRAAGRAGAVAAALDERGVPRLLMMAEHQAAPPGATAVSAARDHLSRHAAGLGLDDAALDATRLVSTSRPGRGSTVARFEQRFEDIEVYRAGVRLLLAPDLSLAAASGHLVPGTTRRPRAGAAFRLPASEAVAATLAELFAVAVVPSPIVEEEPDLDFVRFTLADSDPVVLGEPARAKKVWFVDGDEVRAAWFVELYASLPAEPMRAYRLVLDAGDARVLERRDLTHSESFDYRVFAEATGDKRPFDSPLDGMTPHPTAMPSGFKPASVAPQLVTMEGFNKSPTGMADPWLPPGAMNTFGNNVDAYADRYPADGLSANDFRATVTGPRVFDRTYDLGALPMASVDQGMASVVNLFYLVNWLHDDWYDSGFDEQAGNAQRDNYGRGGKGNDPIRAEAQDSIFSGGRNNANMSTPSDGMSPRMQVYVWTDGNDSRSLTLTPGGEPPNSAASFGPDSYEVTADVVLVADGANPVTDACSPLVNGAAVKGKIALIDRGTCNFQAKVVIAEMAGAVGAIIADNVSNQNPPRLRASEGAVPTIPSMGVRLTDGNSLKAALMMGPVKARLYRKRPLVDAALDNTVTAHEWGHYLHHRLADCSLQQCAAMSEGWGDLSALVLVARDGDDLDGAYPMAPYAARGQADSYYGLRRMPYSVDMKKNGLTFKHISNGQALPASPKRQTGGPNAEVHNAGEVWASMMWEVYVALQKDGRVRGVPFDTVRRKFADYIVAALQITPSDATYLEQRDAVLAAIAGSSKEDLGIAAAAFARRGAGSCAKGPARESPDFTGVVESYEARGRVDVRDITLDDSVKGCDNDGQLDAEETGKFTVKVANGGPVPLSGVRLSAVTSTPGVRFVGEASVAVADIPPLETTTASLTLAIDRNVFDITRLEVEVRLEAQNTCEPTVSYKVAWRANYDEKQASSASDDVESTQSAWTRTGDLGDRIWTRDETGTLDYAWHGIDWGSPSDTSLESPALMVSAAEPFTMEFDYKHAFEAGDEDGEPIYFDGAILEISDDGGASWHDALDWQDPGYNGTLNNNDRSGNALADRLAWVGQSAAWPEYDHQKLDFGPAFAGMTVKVRFRIGTDQAAGNYGLQIDNIKFGGITNTPFATIVADKTLCSPSQPIVANAGADRTSMGGDMVTLDASASTGGDNRLTFQWMQTAGPTVSLSDPSSAQPTLVAPPVNDSTTLTFAVTVSDGTQSASDTVDVTVVRQLSEGCCSVTASADRGVDVVPALALLAIVFLPRRRRGRSGRVR